MSEADDRPCESCAHFLLADGHPLHRRCCARLGSRLLSADAERANDHPQGCGPEGRAFVAKEVEALAS